MNRRCHRPQSRSPNKNGPNHKRKQKQSNVTPKISISETPDSITPPRVRYRTFQLPISIGRANPNAEQDPEPRPKNPIAIRLNFDEPDSEEEEEEEVEDEEFYVNNRLDYDDQMDDAVDFYNEIGLLNDDLLKQNQDHHVEQCKYANRVASKQYSRSNFKRCPDSLCALLFESFPLEILLRLYEMQTLGYQFKRNLFTRISIVNWTDSLLSSMGTMKTTTFFRKVGRSLRKLRCMSGTFPALVLGMAFARHLQTIYIGNDDTLSAMMFLNHLYTLTLIRSVTIEDDHVKLENNHYFHYFLPEFKRLTKFQITRDIDIILLSQPPLPKLCSLALDIRSDEDVIKFSKICTDMYNGQIETLVLTLHLGENLQQPWIVLPMLLPLEHLTKLKLIINSEQSICYELLSRMNRFFPQYTKLLPQTIQSFSLKLKLQMENNRIIDEQFFIGLLLGKLTNLKRLYLDILMNLQQKNNDGCFLDLDACASARIEFLQFKLYEKVPISHRIRHCSFAQNVRYLKLDSLESYNQQLITNRFPNLEVLSLSFESSSKLSECIDAKLDVILRRLPSLRTILLNGYPNDELNDPFRLTLSQLFTRAKKYPEIYYCLRIPFGQFITDSKCTLAVKETLLQLGEIPKNLRIY